MKLMDFIDIRSAFVPVDMQTAANTGDWIDISGHHRIAFLFFKGVGTAGDDPTLTIQEATDNSGTGAANVAVIDELYHQQDTLLTSVTGWTRATQAAAATYTDLTSAEDQAIWVVDIPTDRFAQKYVNGSIGDVGGNAQLGCLLYILYEPRHARKPENKLDPLD